MSNNVTISVIMGIYNCEETLLESINSLIMQTYQNFEIIMCDDGSVDNTLEIAEQLREKYPNKIKLMYNEKNEGLNYTLNKCLKEARGEYIARMDADDISTLDRFSIQKDFLDSHPQYAFVSSAMLHFDENGEWGIWQVKETPQKEDFIKGSPFPHAPSMIRKDAFKAVQGYDVSKYLLRVEDYHLWIKMYARHYRGFNIQTPLYKMRDDRDALGRRTFSNRINEVYVKCLAVKMLELPLWNLVFIFRPILVGLLPSKLYLHLHRKRLSS